MGREAPSPRTIYRIIGSKDFKKRRIRYRPMLTKLHKIRRVGYSQAFLNMSASQQCRVVYADEKWFTASPVGRFTLAAEDDTPTKVMQSKTNPVKAMFLVAVMEPTEKFDGIIGHHSFVANELASSSSKHRPAGTFVKKTVNVTTEEYFNAYRDSVLPALKAKIKAGEIPKPTARAPLYLQHDNAKPHVGTIDGMSVIDKICDIAKTQFDINMAPLPVQQPAQSPDTNPLDMFFFRIMAKEYRLERAKSRVRAALEQGRHAAAEDNESNMESDNEEASSNSNIEAAPSGDGDDEENFLARHIPLLCTPGAWGRSKDPHRCAYCSKTVNRNGTQCDFRQGWWHDDCARKALDEYRLDHGADPTSVAGDEAWICPQCTYHRCRAPTSKLNLCIMCEKPSTRVGDRLGSDMVSCDSPRCGLFHKTCVGYNEDGDIGDSEWMCPACDAVLPLINSDEDDAIDDIEEVPLHENTVAGIEAAMGAALRSVTKEQMIAGFSTRQHFLKAIVNAKGGNDYEKHWRPHKKKQKN